MALLACLAAPAAAEIPAPVLRSRVTDAADLLPPATEARLESALADFERETSHQIAVLTVRSLEGEPIEAFALRVAERVELGQRGLDNGILLVVAAEDRRARVEVGYGLEGVVPDAVAKRVLEDAIFPRFRAGDFAGGVEAGVESLMRAARGEVVPADRRPPAEPERDPLAALFFAVLLSTLIIGVPLRFSPSRRGRRFRAPVALLSGTMSGVLTWGLLASAGWAGLGFLLGFTFALLAPLWGRAGPRFRRHGGPFGFRGGGGGFGAGGLGGGGFSGGGGRFGGGGASGGW